MLMPYVNTADPAPPTGPFNPNVPDVQRITPEGEYFQRVLALGFTFTDNQAVLTDTQITCRNLLITAGRDNLANWAWRYDQSIPPGTTLDQVKGLINAQADYACPER
jgi:hypothetical protein